MVFCCEGRSVILDGREGIEFLVVEAILMLVMPKKKKPCLRFFC